MNYKKEILHPHRENVMDIIISRTNYIFLLYCERKSCALLRLNGVADKLANKSLPRAVRVEYARIKADLCASVCRAVYLILIVEQCPWRK